MGNSHPEPNGLSKVLIKGIVKNDIELVNYAIQHGADVNGDINGVPICFYLLSVVYMDSEFDWTIVETLKWYGMYFHQPNVLKSNMYFTIIDGDYEFAKTNKRISLCKVEKNQTFKEYLLLSLIRKDNIYYHNRIRKLINRLDTNGTWREQTYTHTENHDNTIEVEQTYTHTENDDSTINDTNRLPECIPVAKAVILNPENPNDSEQSNVSSEHIKPSATFLPNTIYEQLATAPKIELKH